MSPSSFSVNTQGNPEKPSLLFLHGFMGSGEDFQEAIAQLTSDYYCLTVDLPGHGQTQTPPHGENYRFPSVAQGIITLLTQLQRLPCFLAGYSLGGRLALYLALNFPQSFPKVILESSSAGLKTHRERAERRQQDADLIERLTELNFAQFLERWYQNPLFASLRNHPQFPAMFQRRLQNQPQQLAQVLRYMGTGVQPPLWDLLPHHNRPLLLLVGEQDAKFQGINQEMARLCPGAQLKQVENCGHNIHLENVNSYVELIRLFLNAP
ncbi:2-succinyl-6-hydroxy-2,4-cyclohexadiene-1-carboxylate synthase [Spirulina subsalsa]|nr:2-succinyl-6-hydroxy-2,4-cyclohexadiene-1-carboxylate synthase [Spirulina subsalsa]